MLSHVNIESGRAYMHMMWNYVNAAVAYLPLNPVDVIIVLMSLKC